MTGRLRYVSSDGASVELDSAELCVGTGLELRSRSWKYELGYRTVAGIAQEPVAAKAEMACSSPERADEMRRAFDRDARAKRSGKLVSGEWERDAYCLKTSPTSWNAAAGHLVATLEFVLLGTWRKYEEVSLLPTEPTRAHGYPHSYPHSYGYAGAMRSLETGSDSPCRPRITVYGPVSKPAVRIGANSYAVGADVPEGAYMVIDGMSLTVKTHMQDGTVRDDYASASRGDGEGSGKYIFEAIPPGAQHVSWAGTYGVDVGWWVEETEVPWSES